MAHFLVQIFFGWPALLGSLLVSLLGTYGRRPELCIFGAVLSTGFAFYLTGLPSAIFKSAGYSLPLLHLSAAVFVRRGRAGTARLLLLPHAAVILYFLFILVAASPAP